MNVDFTDWIYYICVVHGLLKLLGSAYPVTTIPGGKFTPTEVSHVSPSSPSHISGCPGHRFLYRM